MSGVGLGPRVHPSSAVSTSGPSVATSLTLFGGVSRSGTDGQCKNPQITGSARPSARDFLSVLYNGAQRVVTRPSCPVGVRVDGGRSHNSVRVRHGVGGYVGSSPDGRSDLVDVVRDCGTLPVPT